MGIVKVPGYRGSVVDPTPIVPSVDRIDTSDLPEYATTGAEWWAIVDRIWPAIIDIAQRVGFDQGRLDDMAWLRELRMAELADAFERLWEAAPDQGFIHTWPQWERFCDLCSEAYTVRGEE